MQLIDLTEPSKSTAGWTLFLAALGMMAALLAVDVSKLPPASDKKGVTMIEYALIAGLISVVAIALLQSMGTSVSKIFSSINSALSTA